MLPRLALSLLLVCVPLTSVAAAAGPMPVSVVLAKVAALKKKGPLAVFSGDLKRITGQIKQDSLKLRSENQAFKATGKPMHYCAPQNSSLKDKDLLAALEQVPVAQRPRTSTKEAFRVYLGRRFPCRA